MTPPERTGERREAGADRPVGRIRPPAGRGRRTRERRLDTPQETHRPLVRRPSVRPDAFGVFAEKFARFMGTATFLIYMTMFVLLWVGWNLVAPGPVRFDNYPFIFLTLILSLQASYAAPLILLAQNRQEVRDRVVGEQDRQANARAHADMEFLAREVASLRMSVGEVATRDYLRSELRQLLSDLDDRAADHPQGPGGSSAGDAPAGGTAKEIDHTPGRASGRTSDRTSEGAP